jgi:hypothetical protein
MTSGPIPADPSPPIEEASRPRLLDRVRDACRVRHYSLRTEDAYVDWIRRFILFHRKRHPLEMGAAEINLFLRLSQRYRAGRHASDTNPKRQRGDRRERGTRPGIRTSLTLRVGVRRSGGPG